MATTPRNYSIGKRFEFAASHVLEGLPEGHKCGRLHGHNYAVTIQLEADELDDTGFVLDYGDLDDFKQYIDEALDHRHLNDTMDNNPTAENLARHLYEVAERMAYPVTEVTVQETPKTYATYRP